MSIAIYGLVIFVFLLDQLTKLFIQKILILNESVEVVKNFFYLTLVYNTGAAFGIFKNQTVFFIAVSILAVFAIAIYIKRRPNRIFLVDTGFALVLGGALGNLVDRLRFGYVIDFLDFRIWPVFNVADSAVTIGTLLLIISLLRKK